MQKIRKNVFETNSSSTHSISFDENSFIPTELPVYDGQVTIYTGEFGWEVESYTDPATKASYALVHAQNHPELLDMLREAIQWGVGDGVEVIFDLDEDNTDPWSTVNGYIDHQSHGVCDDAFASKETLYRFIFDPNTVLYTDNDNH